MKRYWFRNKEYGWGWQPATREGWLVLLVYAILMVLNIMSIDWDDESTSIATIVRYIVQTFVLSILLIIVAYKTGEKPKWQWGKKKDADPSTTDHLNTSK